MEEKKKGKIGFTPGQQRAIDLHGRDILVSAAAGSGKTAVLVERIIQMVCREEHPVDIDRLLVVTFTNAAAAEMRERVSLGIAKKLEENPSSVHIQKQSALLHNAQITTIDSFCMFLLRNHFDVIGVDPAVRVMDEGENRLLMQDVMDQMLEEKFASKEEDFFYCVEFFCPNGREKQLEAHIQALYRFAQSNPFPEEWLTQRKSDYASGSEKDLENSDYGRYLKVQIRDMVDSFLTEYDHLIDYCKEEGLEGYLRLLQQEKDAVAADYAGEKSLKEYAVLKPKSVFGRLPVQKNLPEEVRERVKTVRAGRKEMLTGLWNTFFTCPLEEALKQNDACERAVMTLIELTEEYLRRLTEKKKERKLVDFSDMEHYALEILWEEVGGERRPSPVALAYREYFEEVLTDEYQDSNLVQEYILQAVSGGEGKHNRFMVGDVKQSIYKFRLARPELFLRKYEDYAGEDTACERIDLSQNFRSRSQVIDTVNHIFERIMSKKCGGIEYDENAALYPGAVYPENQDCFSEMILVEKPAKGAEGVEALESPEGGLERTETEGLSAAQAEGRAIAARIKELLSSFQVTDKASGQLRPVRLKDIVILLRSSGWDEEIKKELEEEGIPAYITSKTGYFAAGEVQELLQFLRILDNPGQDIPLYGVMKSVFGGFTQEEIARIRSGNKKKSLWAVLKEKAQETDETGLTGKESIAETNLEANNEQSKGQNEKADGDLRRKARVFCEKINAYRSCSTYMPIRELLQKIITEYGYLDYVAALPLGARRKANVQMLLTRAADFEKTSYHGLFHFIRYMEQLEKYDIDYGEAELLDENADVLRIMSIHKSKGLEFPVTFIAGLGRRFNMQDLSQALLIDMDMGIGTDYVDVANRVKGKTLRKKVLARKMREDNLSEELRVLYVACTRPKEKMILTATVDQPERMVEEYQERTEEKLSFARFMESSSFLDFILPVLLKTGIRVKVVDNLQLQSEPVCSQVNLREKKKMLAKAEEYADPEQEVALKQRFAWNYPAKSLQKLYTKTTVSELKLAAMAEKDEAAYHMFEEQEVVPYLPLFKRKEEAPDGTVRGNAYHKIMERVDLKELYRDVYRDASPETSEVVPTEASLKVSQEGLSGYFSENPAACRLIRQRLADFMNKQQKKKMLSEQEVASLNLYKLSAFFTSELAERMWKADLDGKLYREQPFIYSVNASRLSSEFPAGESVLIQGIIDAYFVEDGALVLVDYKTDYVKEAEELWNRYETQLDYYGEALNRLTGYPVSHKILYSFCLECCVEK